MKRIPIRTIVINAFLLFFCVLSIFPVYVMVSASFKSQSELAMDALSLPKTFTLVNYARLWNYNSGTIVHAYFNSLVITISHTLIVLAFGSMAAYAFSKYRFKGRNILFTILLATMMIPFELSITPLYIIFSKIKWLNTYWIQIIPFTANVFAMFMLRQYMNGVPDALLEAATIDGAGHLRTFTSIMLPVCKPSLGAVALLVALQKFNDYLWPRVVITKEFFKPIMVILPTLSEDADIFVLPRELIMTGCTIVIIPLIILFICLQDMFMSSVTVGAVKE